MQKEDFWYTGTRDMLFPIFEQVKAASKWTGVIGGEDGVATIGSLATVFKNILGAVAAFTGVVLFVMLVVGGFNFLFSGGDQKKLQQAQGTITSAIIGLVILIAGYLILKTIQIFTGVNVTTFQIITTP